MNLSAWAIIILFATLISFHFVSSLKKESKWGLLRILFLLVGSLQMVLFSSPMSSILACFFGILALLVDCIEEKKSFSQVFIFQTGLAYLMMIAGFFLLRFPQMAVSSYAEWFASGFIILGLFLSAGIPPFQAGVLDLYDSSNPWRVIPFVLIPLPWFVAIPLIDLLSHEVLNFMRLALLCAIVAGAIASLRSDRRVFLCTSRAVLLAWALLFLLSWKESSSSSLMSFTAYLSPTAGLHAVHRLAETRLGPKLVSLGGLGKHLPGLAAFGLFFSLATAGIPLSANFFATEAMGELATKYGVEFVFVSYFAIALLGIAAYRNHASVFMGKSSNAIPKGLDLKLRERIGLISMSSLSPGTSLWLLFVD